MPKSSYGAVLREARTRLGMSLTDAASAAEIDPSVLSRIERGEQKELALSRAVRLCWALGISLDTLVAGVVKPLPRRPNGDRKRELADLKRLVKDVLGRIESMEKRASL